MKARSLLFEIAALFAMLPFVGCAAAAVEVMEDDEPLVVAGLT
jgi:hypothetical protein